MYRRVRNDLAPAAFMALASVLSCGGLGCTDAPAPTPVEVGPAPTYAYGAPTVPRLTQSQYRHAIRDIFGPEVVVPEALEPDVSIDGLYAIGAAQVSVSSRGVEQFETAAYSVIDQAFANEDARVSLVPCPSGSAMNMECASTAIARVGLRAFRRPLTELELAPLVQLASEAATELASFDDGLAFAFATILQSPHFLFRLEFGDGASPDTGSRPYGSYSLASKLSFFLWDTIPDDELLEAAENNSLSSEEGLRAQAERMLESPKAREGTRAFFSQVFELDRLDGATKDPTVFTQASPELADFAREETLRTVEYLVFDADQSYRDLMTLDRTFVNRKLAALYMMPAPSLDGFGEAMYPEGSPRRGLLGHASILNIYSHPVSSSATLRGKFIRTKLLCGDVPPPPLDVETSLPEPSERARTLRERIAIHLENPFCASCHQFTDPTGLGLENFDAIGRYRETELGAMIDPSGELDGAIFSDAIALGEVVGDHPDYLPCLVEHLLRYSESRDLRESDASQVDFLTRAFEANGARIRDLMLTLVLSNGFRNTEGVQP